MKNKATYIVLEFVIIGTMIWGCDSATQESDGGNAKDRELDSNGAEGGDNDSDGDGDGDSNGDNDLDADNEDGSLDGWVDPCQDASPPDCVRYVDNSADKAGNGMSWDKAFTDVQDGIDGAHQATLIDGGPELCEVWVAQGVYHIFKSSQKDTIALKPGVALYGGFSGTEKLRCERDFGKHVSILDGHSIDSKPDAGPYPPIDQVFHIVTGNDDSVIDGFEITGGFPSQDDWVDQGGGMVNYNQSPQISNNLFADNQGGFAVAVINSSPQISDCIFSNNSGAIYHSGEDGELRITRCNFNLNYSWDMGYGGAIFCDNCSLLIDASEFICNSASATGGAISGSNYLSQIKNLRISNSIFIHNGSWQNGGAIATFGGPDGYLSETNLEIINSIFVGNIVQESGPQLPGTGGAIAGGGGNFYNTIFWGNYPADFEMTAYSGKFETWNCSIKNGDGALGNFYGDPRFVEDVVDIPSAQQCVDVTVGDFHLRSDSPCIDRADDSKAPATDIEGHGRVDIPGVGTPGTKADVGAYEYVPKKK